MNGSSPLHGSEGRETMEVEGAGNLLFYIYGLGLDFNAFSAHVSFEAS